MMIKTCLCQGANESCIYCNGKGFIEEEKVEIIKTTVTAKELKIAKSELNEYLHGKDEKMYVTPNKDKPRKQKIKTTKPKRAIPVISYSTNETIKNGIRILDNSNIDAIELISQNMSRKGKVLAQVKKDREAIEKRKKNGKFRDKLKKKKR